MDAQRKRLAEAFLKARYKNGLTAQDIVDIFNERFADDARFDTPYTKGFVTSHWRDLRAHDPTIEQRIKQRYSDTPQATPVKIRTTPTLKKTPEILQPEKVIELDKWDGVTDRSRLDEYRDAQAKLEHDNEWLIAEHDCDNHFPFPDVGAQKLRSLCRQTLQPDLIVVGSDAADAPNIKPYFEIDKRVPNNRALSRFRSAWSHHVNNVLRYDSPNSTLVWIDGNHEEGIWELIKRSKDMYDVMYDYHADTIEQDKEVYFLGSGEKALAIVIADSFMITHGEKATKHSADGQLREYDYQYSGLSGHSHRPDWYTTRSRYSVSWAIGGCGCTLRPAYKKRGAMTKWQHGYSYGIVNTRTGQSQAYSIPFVHTKDSIWCILNGQVLSVKKD